MGGKLLLLFFIAVKFVFTESIQTEKGETLPYHRDTAVTIFPFLVKCLLKDHIFTNKALVVKPAMKNWSC
jgi:hypothetical protein